MFYNLCDRTEQIKPYSKVPNSVVEYRRTPLCVKWSATAIDLMPPYVQGTLASCISSMQFLCRNIWLLTFCIDVLLSLLQQPAI